jgi:hypothetical protein
MARPQPHLGDSHNFGRRVRLRGARVLKPRTVLWEWLVLSAESPLRRLLSAAAAEQGLSADAFSFLPSLKFWRWQTGSAGEVERLRLAALPRSARVRRQLAEVVGRSLALFSWLGIADLHWENLALGARADGGIVFGPLDIEMLFGDLALPTETKLLPDADPEYEAVSRHAAGLRRALPWLGKPIRPDDLLRVAAGYRTTLALLERYSADIAAAIAETPGLGQAPLRVLLRSTGEYVSDAREGLWPPLLEAEREQLERGDIPYFFRLYGKPGIHYYRAPDLAAVGRLPLRGDVPQLDPLLSLSKHLRSPQRERLRRDGLLTVLGAFDDASLDGSHEGHGLRVTFSPRRIVVRFDDGEELHARRNLRAFVASLYLPCTCGETREPIVPSVTVCGAGGHGV